MGGRRWKVALDAGTALAVVGAAALLVHDRLLPAWRQRGVVAEGDRVPSELRLQRLDASGSFGVADTGPAVLFLFQSTCPACERAVPGWRRILDGLPASMVAVAVALEEPAPGLDYARRHLAAAVPARPVDPGAFAAALDVRVVPTTLVVDGAGRLRLRVSGVPGAVAGDSILRLAGRLAGDVSPRSTAAHLQQRRSR